MVAVVNRFYPKIGPEDYHRPKANSPEKTTLSVGSQGLEFQHIQGSLKYGQPLESMAEAVEYVRTCRKNLPDMTEEAFSVHRPGSISLNSSQRSYKGKLYPNEDIVSISSVE